MSLAAMSNALCPKERRTCTSRGRRRSGPRAAESAAPRQRSRWYRSPAGTRRGSRWPHTARAAATAAPPPSRVPPQQRRSRAAARARRSSDSRAPHPGACTVARRPRLAAARGGQLVRRRTCCSCWRTQQCCESGWLLRDRMPLHLILGALSVRYAPLPAAAGHSKGRSKKNKRI